MMKIMTMTIVTLRIPVIEPSRLFTMIFRFLLWEMNLRGLKTLSILSIFKVSKDSYPEKDISIIEDSTTTKSN